MPSKHSLLFIVYGFVLFTLSGLLSSVVASTCGSASPSVDKGIDPRAAFDIKHIESDQEKLIKKLFESLKGSWKGTARITECIPREGQEIAETKEFTTELSVTEEDQNFLELKFDLRSSELKISKQILEKIFIEDNFLKIADGPFSFEVNIVFLKNNFLTYTRKTRLPGKGNIPVEYIRTIGIYNSRSLMMEEISYTNGVFSSKTVYELQK